MVRSIKRIEEFFDSDLDIRFGIPERDLKDDEVDRILSYLKNPVASGVWQLTSLWNSDEEESIGSYLRNSYERRLESTSSKRSSSAAEQYKEQLSASLNKITHYFSLFSYIYFNEEKNTNNPYAELAISNIRGDYIGFFKNLDYKDIKTKYPEAYNIFSTQIVYDGFISTVKKGKKIKTKTDCVFLSEKKGEKITFTSLNKDALTIIENFFSSLKLISQSKIKRLFSPSDLVFAPYIEYLNEVYKKAIDYPDYQKSFSIAISEYQNDNYSHCINTIGILTEHILTQIFESIFRQETEERLSLGDLFQKIQQNVEEHVKPKKIYPSTNLSTLFTELNSTHGKIGTIPDEEIQKEFIETFRKYMQFQKEQLHGIKETIDQSLKTKFSLSIFPKERLTNIHELKRYRNEISHKSRMPINEYEAIRCVYSCFALYSWWREMTDVIDWSKPIDEIINFLVQESKKSFNIQVGLGGV